MNTLWSSFLIGLSSFLLATRTCIRAWMSLNFNQSRQLNRELPALSEQSMYNVNIQLPSFLQVTRTIRKSLMDLKLGKFQP